jgi:hypothetical protein
MTCFLEGERDPKQYAKTFNAWQITAGPCEGEVRGRDVNDGLSEQADFVHYGRGRLETIPLCARHFPIFVAHRLVKGARVLAVKGRKVKPGLEGRVAWIGKSPKFQASRYDKDPYETRIGVVVDGSDDMVFCDPWNFTVTAPPVAQTVSCERCGATFTDGPAGDELQSGIAQRREHEHAAHPRPSGPRIDHIGEDGTFYTARDSALWATCDTHGLVHPYLVEWEGWTRAEANAEGTLTDGTTITRPGQWVRETYAIALADRIVLDREDGTASTVEVDRTFCEVCLAPSLLRKISLRRSNAAKKPRKPRGDGLTYCRGDCLHGVESCDCMCGGMCHGAARGGLGRALQLEGLGRARAAALDRGDTKAAEDFAAMIREVMYPCPGHSREQVAHFYGNERED